jgi:hypothetical protein
VRSDSIVVPAPLLNDDLRFLQAEKDFSVQQLVASFAGELTDLFDLFLTSSARGRPNVEIKNTFVQVKIVITLDARHSLSVGVF